MTIKTVAKYYSYRVTGVWDPEKKNSKQVREYVGPCDAKGNLIQSRRRDTNVISKTFGPYWVSSGRYPTISVLKEH